MALKGLTVTETQVNLTAGGQHDPAFLAVNSMAAIPMLIDRMPGAPDTALTQSLAILLEEVASTPAILPAARYVQARVRSLALLLAADTHLFVTPRVRKALGTVAAVDDVVWKICFVFKKGKFIDYEPWGCGLCRRIAPACITPRRAVATILNGR